MTRSGDYSLCRWQQQTKYAFLRPMVGGENVPGNVPMLLRVMLALRILGFCILLALSVLVLRSATNLGNALIFLAAMWVAFAVGSVRTSNLVRRLRARSRS